MHQTWQTSLEDNFDQLFETNKREGCAKECVDRCLNESDKARYKRALERTLNTCLEITEVDPLESQQFCQKLAQRYRQKYHLD